MNTNPSLREMLKTQTMAAHDKIEQNPVLSGLMASTLTRDAYVKVLKRYLGFFRPLERELESSAELKMLIPDFTERRRTPALVADLSALGLAGAEINEIWECTTVPRLDVMSDDFGDGRSNQAGSNVRSARFLGINYVLEGSTLGGSMMAKKLSTHDFLATESLNFLSGHREKTGVFWQRFIQVLESNDSQNESSLTPAAFAEWRAAATRAASETFTKMDEWMEQS